MSRRDTLVSGTTAAMMATADSGFHCKGPARARWNPNLRRHHRGRRLGRRGPFPIRQRTAQENTRSMRAFVEASQAIGLTHVSDFNGATQHGVGRTAPFSDMIDHEMAPGATIDEGAALRANIVANVAAY